MRRHREEMQLALSENLPLKEARRRLAQLRMHELEERVHPPLKPGCAALCGTAAGLTVEATERALIYGGPPKPHYWWQDERL